MVQNSDWNAPDLARYLLNVKLNEGGLAPNDVKSLRNIRCFKAEASSGLHADFGDRRFRLCDLYPPLDDFRHLTLPVIDWAIEIPWDESSDEGELMSTC